jgi:hypothetical protein
MGYGHGHDGQRPPTNSEWPAWPVASDGGGGGDGTWEMRDERRGAPKKKKMKAMYIWQMINQVGRYLPFFFFNF